MGSSILSEKEKKEEKKDDDEDEEVICYEHDGKNTGDARKLEAWLTQRGINVRETFSPSSSSSALSPSKNENEDTQNGLKSIDDLLKEIENGETVLTEHETTHDDGTVKLSCTHARVPTYGSWWSLPKSLVVVIRRKLSSSCTVGADVVGLEEGPVFEHHADIPPCATHSAPS